MFSLGNASPSADFCVFSGDGQLEVNLGLPASEKAGAIYPTTRDGEGEAISLKAWTRLSGPRIAATPPRAVALVLGTGRPHAGSSAAVVGGDNRWPNDLQEPSDAGTGAIAAHVARHIGEWAMKIALFCLEASRDDYGCLRIRFVLCVLIRTTGV